MGYSAAHSIGDLDEIIVLDPDDEVFQVVCTDAGSQRVVAMAACSEGACVMSASPAMVLDDESWFAPVAECRTNWKPWRVLCSERFTSAQRQLVEQERDDDRSLSSPSQRTFAISPPQSSSPSDEKLMTAKEVARYLRLSVATVLRNVHAGKLRSLRTGTNGHHRFRRTDVDASMKSEATTDSTSEDLRAFIIAGTR